MNKIQVWVIVLEHKQLIHNHTRIFIKTLLISMYIV